MIDGDEQFTQLSNQPRVVLSVVVAAGPAMAMETRATKLIKGRRWKMVVVDVEDDGGR